MDISWLDIPHQEQNFAESTLRQSYMSEFKSDPFVLAVNKISCAIQNRKDCCYCDLYHDSYILRVFEGVRYGCWCFQMTD